MERFEHLKLIARDEAEVERMVKMIRAGQVGVPMPIAIDHEKDGECCRREAWEVTQQFIVGLANLPHPIHMFTAVDNRPRPDGPRPDGPVPLHLRTRTAERVNECSLTGFAQTTDPKQKKLYVLALLEGETRHAFNVGLCRGCAEALFESLRTALLESTEHN